MPSSSSDPAARAVFLSYASQDAEAVLRIAEALRASGVEVWFDKDELVGGDAWDAKIRGQIASCSLFVPVISANTQSRLEGYFRLEWKLAANRTHTMAEEKTFLLPVVIDDTRDAEGKVPAEFKAVQWTRLRQGYGGQAPDEAGALEKFCARVKGLLAGTSVVLAGVTESRPTAALRRDSGQARPATAHRGRGPVLAWIAAGVVALAIAGFVALRPGPNSGAAMRPSAAEPPPGPVIDAKSIAVLPFSNMSDDQAASAFFSDGVHQDILTNLANIREFRVVPHASVESYRGTKKSIAQISRELRVAYVLTGSVRRAGNQVRVTGSLIDARTDGTSWAKSYDKDLTNVFSIQAELATDIAQALKTVLSPDEKTLVERRPTTSTAAYEQFLKAREIRRRFGGLVNNARAMEPFLLEAVRLDPNYAAAYAELVYVYTSETSAAGRQAKLPMAQAAVDQASRLAPDSPEVIVALGDYYLGSGDPARALEQYERFGRLRPKDPDYLGRLAETYQRQGQDMRRKTWELRKQLEDIDPGNLSNLYRTVNLLVAGRRFSDALAVQRRIVTRLPDSLEARHYVTLLSFYLDGSTQPGDRFWSEVKPEAWTEGIGWWRRWVRMQGRLDEAVSLDQSDPLAGDAETITMAIIHGARGDVAAARARLGDLPEKLRRTTAVGGPSENNSGTWIQLGTIEAVLGNRTEAIRCAKRAIELAPTPPRPSTTMARLYAWAGDKDAALTELGQFLIAGAPGAYGINSVNGLRRSPDFFPLREDPRFEALLTDPKNNVPLF